MRRGEEEGETTQVELRVRTTGEVESEVNRVREVYTRGSSIVFVLHIVDSYVEGMWNIHVEVGTFCRRMTGEG